VGAETMIPAIIAGTVFWYLAWLAFARWKEPNPK
jgi:hypothetical protein